jgi:uncharacterized protein (TIGR03663 family)
MALYAACALAALAIRLLLLDSAPLSTPEAMQAVASWHWINGRAEAFIGSPLLFAGNSLLFLLFGASDFAARVLPALFGSALVLLPALVRRELGPPGALIASALLAFSPSLVFFSRNADGVIIAVTCALAALAWGWRYVVDRVPRHLYLAAAAAALALVSAREVWTIVLSAGVFALVLAARARRAAPVADVADGPIHAAQVEQARRDWLIASALFVGIFLATATIFLTHREGLGGALGLFGAWIAGLQPGGSFFDPLRVLVVYEPIPLFFGVIAIVDLAFAASSWDRHHAPLLALALLTVVALLLYSIGGDKSPARVVVLVVPLSLIAGWYIGMWFEETAEQIAGAPQARQMILTQEVPIYLFAGALAAFLYIVLAEFATRGSVFAAEMLASLTRAQQSATLNGVVLTGLIAAAVAIVVFLAVSTVGRARARIVGTAVVLTLTTAWTIRQTALVNFSGAWNPQDWLVATAAAPNVRDMVADLEDVSRWRANDSHTLTMIVDTSLGPMAEWYLRDFRNAQFYAHPTMLPEIQALVLAPDTPINSGKLMSQRYQLETTRVTGAQPNLLRWLIFRDTGNMAPTQAVVWTPQPE